MFDFHSCSSKCSPDAFCYNPGLIGKNYETKRIMFILNRSDSRALETINTKVGMFDEIRSEDSYARALSKSDTGRLLDWMLRYCGLSRDDVYITNAFKCLLPEDREPKSGEYKSCLNLLKEQIISAEPKKIILFGQKPFRQLFNRNDNGEHFLLNTKFFDIPLLALNHPRRLYDLKTRERQGYFIEIRNFLSE